MDFEILARFDMTGGNIKSAVFRAASRAALREEGDMYQHCWEGSSTVGNSINRLVTFGNVNH